MDNDLRAATRLFGLSGVKCLLSDVENERQYLKISDFIV